MTDEEKAAYVLGLQDAITECAAEMECVNLEYSDSDPCRKAAWRGLQNAVFLIQDKIDMLTPTPNVRANLETAE